MQRVPVFSDFFEYAMDAAQRSLLFWDTLRERGNEYRGTRPRASRRC